MNTIAINQQNVMHANENDIPATGRGRALYTVDWFLNGYVSRAQHDSFQVTLEDCSPR
jgi:hypothetical protein